MKKFLIAIFVAIGICNSEEQPKYLTKEEAIKLGLEREEKAIPGVVDNSPKDIYQFAVSFNRQGNQQVQRFIVGCIDNFGLYIPYYTFPK